MDITAIALCAVCMLALGAATALGGPAYPVKVSQDGRYFVDQDGQPVFWLGTTQWQLFREYKLEDARTIIERTRANGMVFAQVMLMGVGDGTQPNVHGAKPWIDDNPLTPNEDYFRNVDAVVQIARENDLIIYADEIYDKVVFDGLKHTAISTLCDDVLCITFGGLSKNWRA